MENTKRSRMEELKRKREERRKQRRKPEISIKARIDEITRPRMGDEALPEATVSLKLDTYSLKEYFRHKKQNKVVKRNQAVQTDKEMENAMIQRYSMVKRRHGSVSVTDRRQNKTIMSMLGNFARQASFKSRDSATSGNMLGSMGANAGGGGLAGRLSAMGGGRASNNPFMTGGGLYETEEVQEEEYHSGSGSFMSEDDPSVMSDDAFDKVKKGRGLKIRELSPEKALKVIRSENFREYFMESSRYLEKVLNVKRGNRFKKCGNTTSPVESEMVLHATAETKDWFIGDLEWSPFLPSVFMTSYFNKEEEDPSQFKTYKDLVHIWNVNFTERPEKELFSYSKIQTVKFHPLANETIICGFESGMVGLFDLRSSKEPVAKSKVSDKGHKSTVTAIDLIGNKNSNSMVSASEDGRVCQWDIAKLDNPVVFVDLASKASGKKDEESNFHGQIEPMSIGHVPGETDFVYLGDMDTKVHQISMQRLGLSHEKKRCITETYSSHTGPVNVIVHSKMPTQPNFHGLMLTGSFDWTIRLWNPKADGKCRMTYTYHDDEITDVSFNPINPFMFSSCDSAGLLCVNSLYGDADEPMFRYKADGPLFNSKWDNSGRLMAMSDDSGAIHLKRFKAKFFEYEKDKLKNLERVIKK